MAYRKILVPLTGAERDSHVLRAALDVAKAFDSHIAGIYVKPDPAEVLPYIGEGVSPGVVQEIMDASNAAAKRGTAAAADTFKRIVGEGSGLFEVREGSADGVLTEEARLSDLSVFDLPSQNPEGALRSALESTLVNARKPLLLVPRGPATIAGRKIVVGWDGGAAAAQAVSAAIPLMKRAESVEILTVTSGTTDATSMDRLRGYLRLHGLNPVEHGINPGGQGTAAALVDGAQKSGAGLLVMGGYGHSRVREFVLGGVTRYVFAHVTMPVFMAH